MKVAIVSRAENVSGKEIMTLELGEGLRSAGHEVVFVTSFWNDGSYQKRLNDLGFEHCSVALGSISATLRWDCVGRTLKQLIQLPPLWKDFRQFMKETGVEQAVHTSWHHLILLWPYLSTERDWYWVHEVLPDKPHYRRLFMRLTRRLRGFVAVSQAVADSLSALGVPAGKIHVVHNGLRDISAAAPVRDAAATPVRIGIVGQVAQWKGHHDLLDAMPSILAAHPDTELHIYGTGPEDYSNALEAQARRLNIVKSLHWHGYVENRAGIYGNLDLCVLPVPPGASEALPTIAIEAGFFGLPIVATRIGGLCEIVEDDSTGFLVSPGDRDALVAQINLLAGDADLRARMGLAARERVLRLFNRDRFVTDFSRILSRD